MADSSENPISLEALIESMSAELTLDERDQLIAASVKVAAIEPSTVEPLNGEHFLDEGRAELSALATSLTTKYPESEAVRELVRRYPHL